MPPRVPQLIALFGATGTGKTTFVNDASGENLEVGEMLESCTRQVINTSIFQVDSQDVVLFDTPGFDDTDLSDTDILKLITAFLTSTYERGYKLTGIIYLHRIVDIRVGGISRRTFQILRGLCGQETLSNVLIVTNMWSNPPTAKEIRHEKELQENPKFFQPAIAAGARMARRSHKDSKSAHDIIRMLLDKPPVAMQIQRQIVDEGEEFHTTDAAMVLGEELVKVQQRHLEEIEAVKEELRQARDQNNTQAQSELREFLEQAIAESTRLSKEIQSLREGFEQDRMQWESRVSAAEAAQQEAEEKQREMVSELEELRERAERASGEELRRVGSDCTWPSAQCDSDPWTEFSFEDWETIGKIFRPVSGSTEGDHLDSSHSHSVQAHSSAARRGPLVETDLGALGLGQTLDKFEGCSTLVNYHKPNSRLKIDESGPFDTGFVTINSKVWDLAQDYGPKVMWPPPDEKEGFDPEGIMPLVQRSISMLRITDDPVFQDVRDFFSNFMTRFYYDYAAIHENIHFRIRRRFEASNTLKQAMLGMAALFRSNYQQSLVPTSMRNYAKELHRIASQTLQIELENNSISPWVKLAGLWEVMNYEYFDGNLVSYYSHLNQAASIVRLAIGGNSIDILRLSGEQTFDLRCFAWCDVLSSMALTRPTLLSYESDILNPPQDGDFIDPDRGIEWIFGCPDVLFILLARTSAVRHARTPPEEKLAQGQDLQQLIEGLKFRPVFAQRSPLRVARLAAQELWRHAAILYVHQSIFKSKSSHPEVKNSVKLIIQLASTLTPGVNPDCFLSVPYFIAGSFSTTQKDRYTLRSRLLSSGNERFLRDLVAALDDVWKEADATGSLTTWSKQHPPRIIF